MHARPLYLLICGAATFAGSTAFTLNLVYQATVAGLSPLQMILVGTVLETVCFLAQIPTGVLADLRSRRLSVIIGYLLFGAGIMIEGLVPAFAAIIVANIVWGIGFTFVDGAQEAWLADEVGPEAAGEVMLRGGQVAQAASVAGIGAAVSLAAFGLNVPIVAAACVWIALGLLLIFVMKEDGFTPPVRQAGAAMRDAWRSMAGHTRTAASSVRRDRALLLVLGATLCTAFASEGLDRLTQPFLIELGLPGPVWFGGIAVCGSLGAIAVTEVIRRRMRGAPPHRVLRAVALLRAGYAVATVVLAMTGAFWQAAGVAVVITLLRAATGPLMGGWLAVQTESATRATVYSLFSQIDSGGQVVGGPPLGLIAERFGIRAVLVSAAGVVVPAVALLAAASGRVRDEVPR
ncbi:MFS transporter [Nonomuraea sp. NPDC050663]|uniref:MFS transporter n=1 Tax=Nonomuraea sp. NPDC050663 TaxID=3364370 RepID=UPI0037B66D40